MASKTTKLQEFTNRGKGFWCSNVKGSDKNKKKQDYISN